MFKNRIFILLLAVCFIFGTMPFAFGASVKASSSDKNVYISGLRLGLPGETPNDEYVKITNKGKTYVSMKGWRIQDEHVNHKYFFPSSYKLKAGATVTLKSGKGSSSAKVLYWNHNFVWNNINPDNLKDQHGDIASLYSPRGLVSSKDLRVKY
jgi:hypothetical protein